MADCFNRQEFFLGLPVTVAALAPLTHSVGFLIVSVVVHEEHVTHFYVVAKQDFRCHLLPPPLLPKESILPAGEIFIAIQKTCSSIKCVSGVIDSRTLQNTEWTSTCMSACMILSWNTFKEKCFNSVSWSLAISTSEVSRSFSEGPTTFPPIASLFYNPCQLFQEKSYYGNLITYTSSEIYASP